MKLKGLDLINQDQNKQLMKKIHTQLILKNNQAFLKRKERKQLLLYLNLQLTPFLQIMNLKGLDLINQDQNKQLMKKSLTQLILKNNQAFLKRKERNQLLLNRNSLQYQILIYNLKIHSSQIILYH